MASDAAGRLFVADNASHHIYLFDARGHALDTLGGPGEGPGEFKMGLWGIAYEPPLPYFMPLKQSPTASMPGNCILRCDSWIPAP
ncbi:6-bladed beta-propeller [Rhodothermus marinus]|uniref:6-bladed beta-propeller n=1 Tax=Rhodothermus marinus TaxID=29549 RepID=UPI001FB4C2E5|nr:6-bladed beta-propeller [Rhodothermus marinus]